eukprot:PhM_4_TR14775/c0_g1_i1/m.74195
MLLLLKLLLIYVCFITPSSSSSLMNTATYSTSSWMTNLDDLLSDATLLDITLPGSHDSLSYDLSTTVAMNANSIDRSVARIAHDLHSLIPRVGEYIRRQAQTQTIDVIQQLEAGIRFFDVRVTFTAPASESSSSHERVLDWYGVHFTQTNHPVWTYLDDINSWLIEHPKEVIVLWISQHGRACGNVFPGATKTNIQSLYRRIINTFSPDRIVSTPLNTTRFESMWKRKQQVVVFGDIHKNKNEFDGLIKPSCERLENRAEAPGVENVAEANRVLMSELMNQNNNNNDRKHLDQFWLRSITSPPPEQQIKSAFLLEFVFSRPSQQSGGNSAISKKCAMSFSIPGMVSWCPRTLLDTVRLRNFYTQLPFEKVVAEILFKQQKQRRRNHYQITLPMAFYADGILADGSLDIGGGTDDTRFGYSYTSTIVLWNILKRMEKNQNIHHRHHRRLVHLVELDRQRNSLFTWEDRPKGRHTAVDWV